MGAAGDHTANLDHLVAPGLVHSSCGHGCGSFGATLTGVWRLVKEIFNPGHSVACTLSFGEIAVLPSPRPGCRRSSTAPLLSGSALEPCCARQIA